MDEERVFKCIIEIPNGVKEINEKTFGYDYTITEIHIPESVKIIPMKCFEECYDLENITIRSEEHTV